MKKNLTNLLILTMLYSALSFFSISLNAQYNYFAGTSAGSGNNSWYSTAVGYEALSSSNTGISNIGIGYHALRANSSGYHNCGIGNGALEQNTTGNGNTAVGIVCLIQNTTGNENTGVGHFCLWSNNGGYFNTAVGSNAMKNNTTGFNNTVSGYKCLFSNVSGYENCVFGHFASYTSTQGAHNNAFGAYSLYNNTGENNCAFGTYSLQGNSTGYANSAFGHQALTGNTTGYQNVGIGDYANDQNTTGSNNTSVGSNALHLNNGGSNNVCVGQKAGSTRALYNKCTFIGATSDATANNYTNATALGYGAKVSGSNKVRIGNTAVTSIGGQVGWTTVSDLRLKENIKDSKLGLDFILNLHPVTYNYKDENQRGSLYTGLIAQEVDAAAKEEGIEFSGVDKNGEYWGIRYAELTVPLIKGMQEQHLLIEQQQSEIAELKNEINDLKECVYMLCNTSSKINHDGISPQLSIVPNPANDVATISISSNDKMQKLVVKIIDASGKIIRTYNSETVSSSFEINTLTFSKGTYLVQMFNQSEIIKTEKLIVQ